MAELKMSNKSMKAISGHVKDDEIQLYTKAANQERLARQAIEQLSTWEASSPEELEDELAKAAKEALAIWSGA